MGILQKAKDKAPPREIRLAREAAEKCEREAARVAEEAALEATRWQAEAEILNTAKIGQLIEDKGIFAGVWKRGDKKYCLFGAPTDLTDNKGYKALLTFKDTVKEVAGKRNWNGHEGGEYINETAVYYALENGSGRGKWIIPTFEMLKLLCACQHIGAFEGTYTGSSETDRQRIYLSCTEHIAPERGMMALRFADGFRCSAAERDNVRLSCRPVRVEFIL